jgi:hypothetical protein
MAAGLAALTAAAAEPRWDLPQAVPEGFLPKLGAIKTDGDLAEWNVAAAVPLRFASYLAIRKPTHTWNGPADCGMEVLCGWNDEGLCLAGFVADDEVQNDTAPENLWQKDCLELFLDGRTGGKFMTPPYTRGSYQMYVRPPVGGKAAELCVNPLHGAVEGARVGGKLVAGGWTFELVLPWSAFPEFSPRAGAHFGLQFGLDDYDSRDAGTIQPLMISWQAATILFESPQKLLRWTLVDAFPKGAGTPLGTVAAIDMPSEVQEEKTNTVKAAIELGRSLAGQAASGRYEVKDWTGAAVAKGPIRLAKLAPPWQDSAAGGFEWTLGSASDGVYTVEAAFADAQGAPLGVSRRSVVLLRFVGQEGRAAAAEAIARIEKADIAKLAQAEPFRAAAWLGAAACVEKLKWAAELRNRRLISDSKRELAARLALLETGSLPKDCEAPFSLLALSARPEAQVVVEFPAYRDAPAQNWASVTFYWGGFPLASASIMQFPDAETARKQFENESQGWWTRPARENLELAGLPARAVQRPFFWPLPFDLARFDPTNQVLVCSFQRNFATAVNVADLNKAHVDAAVISDSAPRAVRKAVQKWARKTDRPVMDFQHAATNTWFLMAGLPTGSNDVERLRPFKKQVFRSVRYDGQSWITALDGSRSITAQGNREIAAMVVRLIKEGKPVTVADVDALRQAVLRSVPRPQETPEPVRDMDLYSGDVHVHSGYSDGSSTPVGMALAAMYCGMDFVALTDHNTVDGAQVASRLFRDCGLDFPVVVGEEITTGWAHLNAYPLRENIPTDLPPYATIRAAHQQGAVIQWNHPGGYDRDWYLAHGEEAMRGTGLDAWEHPLPQYDQWKKEGRLPTLVGSTDTHGATYGESERTLILAPSPAADDVAEAVRRQAVLLVSSGDPHVFLGPDEMIARAVAALADGPAQQERRAARIKAALAKADVPALLRRSPSAVVKPADLPSCLAKE